ncbi:hypothetical protein CEXT_46121 [Caerostris extrusa]|uniref:Uncharacterized protein n=1 Tax=Caerostris extrusa TaxID=172846 RepID=A0AAV4VW08_CAEEX|nr:hypothetical protein CEXT_46121 [Caerostris extrusa]
MSNIVADRLSHPICDTEVRHRENRNFVSVGRPSRNSSSIREAQMSGYNENNGCITFPLAVGKIHNNLDRENSEEQ